MNDNVQDLPCSVSKISFHPDLGMPKFHEPLLFKSCERGSYVSVRLAGDDPKTYLGIYLGDMAISVSVSVSKDGVLTIAPGHRNPAMYIADLNTIVFGVQSWWSPIKSPEDLRQITDADIDSVWYVQALKAMLAKEDGDDQLAAD